VSSAEQPEERGRLLAGRVIGVVVVVGALLATALVLHLTTRYPRTDDAAVRANVVGMAPHVSGPIVELPIVDNQAVAAGDLLFVVDPRPYDAALARAEAELAIVESELVAQERAVAAAEAEVAHQQAELDYARELVRRLSPLQQKGFATADRQDDARRGERAAAAGLARAESEVARARALLAQDGDLNARRTAAEAAVSEAKLDVGYCRVIAPFDGLVTNLNIAVGQYARQGQEVFALVDARAWYVMANFRETYLDAIRPGMEAEVYLASYPGRRFRGVVQGVGWAIFLPNGATDPNGLPDVRPSLDWVRLAARFPVRIRLEAPDPEAPYRMGATAVVTVRGDSAR
jgi:membrane fusion protein, multidrug efflux system